MIRSPEKVAESFGVDALAKRFFSRASVLKPP
jgi:hypothetical protein